jgi:NitT/TauT family transport system ATP-binding protein
MSASHAELRGVSKTFPAAGGQEDVHALGPIDLDLAKGEFVAVVGPSGCGKSTLLEVLAGLTAPSAGSVSFEGRPVKSDVPAGIGVVFQEDASLPWLTVWDNIAFGLRRNGTETGEIKRRVHEALSFMGLDNFAHAYPAQLSGGMRHSASASRARWCSSRASSCWTSRSAPSINRRGFSWATNCCGSGARRARRSSLSPTRSTRR